MKVESGLGCLVVSLLLLSHSYPAAGALNERLHLRHQSHDDDTRVVSAYVSSETGSSSYQCKIVSGKHDDADAQGAWNDQIDATGWGFLTVKTRSQQTFFKVKDAQSAEREAYAAGCVEGYLTPTRIEQYWGNYALNEYGKEGPSVKLIEFVQSQKDFIETKIEEDNSSEPLEKRFWDSMKLIMSQFHGLCDGYYQGTQSPTPMTILELYLLNSVGDLEDLNNVFPRDPRKKEQFMSERHAPEWTEMTDCSGLIHVLPDNSDVAVGHTTWRDYYAMLRIYKKYEFGFMHNKIISMSSSPGFLHSKDDFYVVPGMAVLETTNSIFNKTLYDRLTTQSAFSWQRAAIGVWQATDPEDFTKLFALYNSGTYNNQWMAIQLSQFQAGHPLPDSGIFWIIEQIPGFTKSGDVSDVLKKQGYWPSYNIPYFKQIYTISGYEEQHEKYGNKFSYEHCPRANIFRRNQTSLKTLDDVDALMRYNNYLEDPLSEGNPMSAISSRADLIRDGIPKAFGGVDSKVTSFISVQNGALKVKAISGPTHTYLHPFSFSKSDNGTFENVPHAGVPDTWDFSWVETTDFLPEL